MSECRNRGTRIPDHHGIAFKPEIAGRQTFGHWEGDLMIFNREHGSTNLTSLIERKSRYTMLAKNTDRHPGRKAVSRATINRIRRFLPRETNLAALDAADKLKEHWSPEQISFFSGALPVCTVYVAAKQTGDI
jgi:IS30 family transposase